MALKAFFIVDIISAWAECREAVVFSLSAWSWAHFTDVKSLSLCPAITMTTMANIFFQQVRCCISRVCRLDSLISHKVQMERERRKEQSVVWGMISSYWLKGIYLENKTVTEVRWQRIYRREFIIMLCIDEPLSMRTRLNLPLVYFLLCFDHCTFFNVYLKIPLCFFLIVSKFYL